MLTLRFTRTLRDRAPEWILAFMQLGYGGTLLRPGRTFDHPYFAGLKAIADENVWGTGMVLIALMRIIALYINGQRKETPRFRQVGSLCSMFVWLSLTLSSLQAGYNAPGTFIDLGLFILEAVMFSYAATDASRVKADVTN